MLLWRKGRFQSKYLHFLSFPTLLMLSANFPKNSFSDHVSLKLHQTLLRSYFPCLLDGALL